MLLTDPADRPAAPEDRSPAKRERYVSVDTDEFAQKLIDGSVTAQRENEADDGTREKLAGYSVAVELFDGERVRLEPFEVVQTRNGEGEVASLQWLGEAADPESGVPLGSATFSVAYDLPGDPVGGTIEYGQAPGTFPSYSHGHYVVDKASTTMTYPSVCPQSQPCPRTLQFSTPGELLIDGGGAAAGTGTRNNERTIDQVSWAVRAYRPASNPQTGVTNDYVWQGTGSGGFDPQPLYDGQTSPHRPIGGDFDGDGHSDVFWFYPGSQNEEVFWFDGHISKSDGPLAKHVSGSYRATAGDFDGDGKDDIFWHKPGTGTDYIWWGTSRGSFGNVESAKAVNGPYRPFSGDFDGDGRDDVFFYAPGAMQDYVWWGTSSRSAFGSNPNVSAKSVSGYYDARQPGNYDGDTEDDVFWYQAGSGDQYVWWGTSRSSFGNVASAKSVNGTYELTSGDYDGDGDSDLFFYAPGSGTDYKWNGQPSRSGFGPSSQTAHTINGYYVPTSGDTGDDGREDIYWFGHG